MYRFSGALDLSPVVGEFTTQLGVFREGKPFARWAEGTWPDPGFYEIMNAKVVRCEIPNERLIVLEFENGIAMHLEDSSDQYESMQIYFEGDPSPWVI